MVCASVWVSVPAHAVAFDDVIVVPFHVVGLAFPGPAARTGR